MQEASRVQDKQINNLNTTEPYTTYKKMNIEFADLYSVYGNNNHKL